MKKINKKGFTLIELLAVIVVLAILLVIAVPRVLDVIESARSEALGKSAQIVAKYLKQAYAINMVKGIPQVAIPTATTCPEGAGFSSDEGNCTYTMALTGTTAIYTVVIDGEGRFEGWQATSVDGAEPTIEVKVD